MATKATVRPRSNGQTTTMELPVLDLVRIEVTIKGKTPLIMHRFSDKAQQQIEDKQGGKAKLKRAAKKPDDLYKACLYHLGDHFGFPAGGVKKAIMRGAKYADAVMKDVGCSVHVLADNPDNLIDIHGEHRMRRDYARNANGGADLRYRAEFTEWSGVFVVEYNQRVFTNEQILSMINHAGFHAGLGDWRPEKGGSFGQFTLAEAREV